MADPITLALTGVLPAGVIAGALLAYPVARLLLHFYHRSVARSMAAESGATREAGAAGIAATPPGVALQVVGAHRKESQAGAPVPTQTELAYLFKAPWRAAAVYAAAGAVFAAVMTVGWLIATRDPAIPMIKLLLLFWTYFWPAVLTVNLVASMGRSRWTTVCAYFGVFVVLVMVALGKNPSMRWHELPFSWLLTNGPPTLLLAAYLTRRIRAVGPMVLAFMVLALTGSQVLVTVAGAKNEVLEVIAKRAFAAGLTAAQVFWGMMLLGLFAFAIVGWFLLKWLGRRYERKRLSDETLTIDALWLLFGIVHSIDLVFEGWVWFFTGLVAFAAFKAATVIGFSLSRAAPRPKPRTLLLLRVFALGTRSERLFDLLRAHWLHLGNITLIAGPDLITTTVEPHEFLDFLGGEMSRQFVRDRDDLARRISAMDTKIDPDGRFRADEFFCRADTWQITMHELAGRSDAVLMDLRSFSPANRGCLFELGELLNSVDLTRVVFVIDASTDRRFLETSLTGLWSTVSMDSPNRMHKAPAARLLELDARLTGPAMRQLFAGLCTPIPTPDLG
jgi:hypothetical protein